MDTILWNKILQYNLDGPVSEYGFSTRLENENCWTTNFAINAIIEYKKFMYLATLSEVMISPSEIVDIVWHQHLIFTQSYDAFCLILKKKIIHVPSTHNQSEFDQFEAAKHITEKLYLENFGPQPAGIWNYPDMCGSLNMDQSEFAFQKVISTGAWLLVPLLIVACLLLQSWYITINNPYFIEGFVCIVTVSVISLEIYNSSKFKAMVSQWPQNSFIFNLEPLELICLKNNGIKHVIHAVVNNLILDDKIKVLPDNTLAINDLSNINNAALLCAAETVNANSGIDYPALLTLLMTKNVFNKTARAINNLKSYVAGSRQFTRIFIANFTILYTLLLLGAVRLITGVQREKPVTIITGIMVGFLILMIGYLYRLTIVIGTSAIPRFYKKNLISDGPEFTRWDWNYFVLGSAVYAASFAPLVAFTNNNSDFSSSDNSSGSSSCGSGGGSSCGGCGSN